VILVALARRVDDFVPRKLDGDGARTKPLTSTNVLPPIRLMPRLWSAVLFSIAAALKYTSCTQWPRARPACFGWVHCAVQSRIVRSTPTNALLSGPCGFVLSAGGGRCRGTRAPQALCAGITNLIANAKTQAGLPIPAALLTIRPAGP
jgi:hypothetical protein